MRKPEAFIFDLDGVLTDTAKYHYLAWKSLADKLGMKFELKDNERLKGVSRIRSFEIILEINDSLSKFTKEEIKGYANLKNQEYVSFIDQVTPDDVLPGILDFLEEARKYPLKLAVASASKNAKKVLKNLKIENYFDYIADANEIVHGKPDPEVFLDCATHLQVNPEVCIGFEDAQAGIEAIHRAKMFSVGIGVEVTSIKPDIEVKTTEGLNLKEIIKQYQKQ